MAEHDGPVVFDSSALLAFLQGERGADAAERWLAGGGTCGSANWSEVAQKVVASGADWGVARAILRSYALTIEPVVVADAERAAADWIRGSGLSLGDRLCLALAERLDAIAVTADAAWQSHGRVQLIR